MSEAYEILGDRTDVAKFYFGHKRSAISYRISEGEVSDLRLHWTTTSRLLTISDRSLTTSFASPTPLMLGSSQTLSRSPFLTRL
jgi:hypothetical protein